MGVLRKAQRKTNKNAVFVITCRYSFFSFGTIKISAPYER